MRAHRQTRRNPATQRLDLEKESFAEGPVGEGTLEDPEVTKDRLVENGSDGSVRVTETEVATSSGIVDEYHETETNDGGDDVDVAVTTTKAETKTETTTEVTKEKDFDKENGDWSE